MARRQEELDLDQRETGRDLEENKRSEVGAGDGGLLEEPLTGLPGMDQKGTT